MFRLFALSLLLLCCCAVVPAPALAAPVPEYSFEDVFKPEELASVVDAQIVRAVVQYASPEGPSVSTERLFLVTAQRATAFAELEQLLASPEFLAAVSRDFSLRTRADAARFGRLFQKFGWRRSATLAVNSGSDWYFVCPAPFGELTGWRVGTNPDGSIRELAHEERVEVALPTDEAEVALPEATEGDGSSREVAEEAKNRMVEWLEARILFEQTTTPLAEAALARVSTAQAHELGLVLNTRSADGEITDQSVATALRLSRGDEVAFFGSWGEMLTDGRFLESMRDDYRLRGEEDAAVFAGLLDAFEGGSSGAARTVHEAPRWYFVREESFGRPSGFVVEVDEEGRIRSIIQGDLDLAVAVEEPFDEATADWGFVLREPREETVRVVEGTTFECVVEFNAKTANRAGAWVLTRWNGETVGVYAGSDLESPHCAVVPAAALVPGHHDLEVLLMRPGMDLTTAHARAAVAVEVVPFDDSGVDWAFRMTTPAESVLRTVAEVPVPVALEYNADAANRLAARLEIRYRGKAVGGQRAPHHQAVFETKIPGEVLQPGEHEVEFVLVSPRGDRELGKASLRLVVD